MKVVVDLWKTSLHGAEIGIRQKEQHRAKARQFSKDMDLYGRIKVDGKDYGYVGYRKALWENEDPFKKRLVVKAFSNEMTWLGTIEENIIRELSLTLASREPSPAFTVIMPRTKIVFPIERLRPRGFETDAMILTYINDEKNTVKTYVIKSKRFSIGNDWSLVDLVTGKEIIKVDGKVLDVGGRYELKSKTVEDMRLFIIVALYAGTLRFYDDLKEKLENIQKTLKKKKELPAFDKQAVSFFFNPRIRR
ncbi:MAG: hypothetical protein ACTSU6_03750 [Candidatus Njordarchaeales archaeon]